MSRHPNWTETELEALRLEIDHFEEVAFNVSRITLNERKRAMKAAAIACTDENIRSILQRSVDYIGREPAWVRQHIKRARDHVIVLSGE